MNIRYFILFILALTAKNDLSAQKIEFFGGININNFKDSRDETGDMSSAFESANGYTVGFSFDNYNLNGIANKFSLSYSSYGGHVITTNIVDGIRTSTTADVEKQVFNVAVYPIAFFTHQLYFHLGLDANFTIGNTTKGVQLLETKEIIDLESNSAPEIHKGIVFGLNARLSYNLYINDVVSIVPQYVFYYGLTDELENIESDNVKSWRQSLLMGIAFTF